MEKYKNLFSPIQIGGMTLRNRIVAAPMGIIPIHKIISSTNYGGMSAWDRSMGGVGMVHICDECLDIFSKYEMDATKEQINVAKQDGSKVSCEIGLFCMTPDAAGFVYGPSDGIRFDGRKMKAMTREKMKELIQDVTRTCILAKNAGMDCITIHAGHDGLLSQFMSPAWNHREDEYGGSVENRCRFVVEALKHIRNAVGNDFPLILRVSRQLAVKETYPEEDMLEALKNFEGIVDMVNISCGMDVYYEANVHAVPTIFEPHSYNKDFAKKVKERTSLKVCIVGAVMSPEEGEKLIADGYTDCVMYGRSLIADPYWPKKILEGREDEILPCIRCMNCYHIATEHRNTQCSVNPRFRRENRLEMTRPFNTGKKKVGIIGGGPAGMVAALGAVEAGHDVVLFEKNPKLGGLLNWAAKGPYKEDLRKYKEYLIRMMDLKRIDVRLRTDVNRNIIEKENFDRLIIAIGSDDFIPPIKGSEKMVGCLQAIDSPENIGEKVVIVGGGSVGMELALELSLDKEKEITVVEMASDYATNGNNLYRIALKQHVRKQNNLHILIDTKCLEIKENSVVTTNGEIYFDTVINAAGRRSKKEEAASLFGIVADTMVVGDCERVGAVIDAINIAYFMGRNA